MAMLARMSFLMPFIYVDLFISFLPSFERYPEDEASTKYGRPGLDLFGHLFEEWDYTA